MAFYIFPAILYALWNTASDGMSEGGEVLVLLPRKFDYPSFCPFLKRRQELRGPRVTESFTSGVCLPPQTQPFIGFPTAKPPPTTPPPVTIL